MEIAKQKLREIFKINELRNFQKQVIEAFLQKKDILVFVMTGGGKSLCYQLPAVIHENKLVLVISPLKSLMIDQINELEKINIKCGIFSGDQSKDEKIQIINNLNKKEIIYRILYTNPETLQYNDGFLSKIQELNKRNILSLVVFDEAHCLSLWGHDFRPSYLQMKILRDKLENVPFMALTATATPRVEKEIKLILNMKHNCECVKESFQRKNLNLIILDKKNKDSMIDILDKIKNIYNDMSGIIYCHSRKKCEKFHHFLLESGIKTNYYHAGMSKKTRKKIQDDWKSGKIPIVIATIAFGMGINKHNVRFVIHTSMPQSIENYYQEIGRGGRDGKKCDCIIYYNYSDKIAQQKLIEINKNCDKNQDKYKYHQIDKLNKMVSFLENKFDCRHYLLTNYFGEITPYKCNNFCDNCLNNSFKEEKDITEITKKIFKLIIKYDVSRSRIKLILNGKDKYKSHEKLDEPIRDNLLDRIMIFLISNKYIKEELILTKNNLFYEKLYLYKKCNTILKNNKQLKIFIKKENLISKYFNNSHTKKKKINDQTIDEKNLVKNIVQTELYKLLHNKRSQIAKEKKIPPYCVLNNKTLLDIVEKKPNNINDLLHVNGIGKIKIEKYGEMIMEQIVKAKNLR